MSNQSWPGVSSLVLNEPLLWEKGRPGRVGVSLPESDVPAAPYEAEGMVRTDLNLPDLAELDVVRHYTRLSTWNFGVDTGMYPLGSCTMKYNPKINEKIAALPGFAGAHPLFPSEYSQGALRVLYETEQMLCAVTGLEACSLQPSAGAHGELTGIMLIQAWHRAQGNTRTKMLIPDTAHGTNPASAALCGFSSVKVPLGPDGILTVEDVAALMDDDCAGIMITNPNTLGLFESNIKEIAELVHARGGLVYGDAEALRANRTFPDMGQPAVELHAIDYSPAGDGAPPDRAAAEAEFVAARIAEMLRQEEKIPDGDGLRPVRPGDIVILMRSLSGRTQTYLDALRRHGIPASCGSDDLFAAEEIRFLFALLQIIDNPHQDIPLLTVLLSPFGGYPADELARLRAGDRDADLYTLLCESKAPICAVLEDLRRTAQEAPLRTLLEEAEERLLLPALCAALPNGPQRQRNLAALRSIADSYERAGGCGLPGFLRHLEGLRERGVPSSGGAAAGAVRLMTIHSSKGLEFPVVFLADLCKSFNRTDSRANVLTDPVLGLGSNCYDPAARILCPTIARQAIARRLDQEAVSEEMRVLYVAMTRPQYRLIMTCCAARLTRRLESYAQGLSLPPDAALLEGADSLGDWILLAAMTRPEAGELFAAAGQPDCALQGGHPWRIQLHTAVQAASAAGTAESVEPACEQPPEPRFLPPYGHAAAVTMPTKLTATQLKGRELDNEAAEQTAQTPKLHFPVPRFEEGRRALTAAERGTALHLAMQHLNYAACADESGLRSELERLGRQKFLTPQQLEAVDPERLRRFFASPLGQRVLQAPQVVREFKFSVLDDGANYDPALEGEEILLQGVTDCCLIELDGLVILDFKSDRLRPGAERERAEYYRGQLDAYSRALSRIFELPVSERIVYFFATDTAVSL